MPSRIVFPEKQQVELQQFDSVPIASNQVRMRTLKSLMSTGTENIIFNQLFEPGTHWDRFVRYPYRPGYLSVGEIVEIGSEVTVWRLGDRVATRKIHASEHVGVETDFLPIPIDADPSQMAWFALAEIGFMGAKAAEYRLGDSVLIVGAGPIGQMSTRWARAAGCEKVIVLDPVLMRLEMARKGGATDTLSIGAEGAAESVMAINHGELPDIVVDTTGHAGVFQHCLALPKKHGKLVLLGDTGDPGSQRLTPDVVIRGIRIVGAHITHTENGWTDERVHRLFLALFEQGRFELASLNTHVFKPDACVEAYRLVNERRGETMGVVFDWSD